MKSFVALIAFSVAHGCDEFHKVQDSVCADDCLDAMIGICPQALVVKTGGLSAGDCKSLGYTVANGTNTQKAGPCGDLTVRARARCPPPSPSPSPPLLYSSSFIAWWRRRRRRAAAAAAAAPFFDHARAD